ncbi:complex I NDUFA9 subunit family protein [Desulfofalx alkaliphila]|uniref:complex I NDUFA9 subunit family protein n=1 Tax=Desulfofalx alkaliphila TaxID=105483 RepID=UPI0005550C8E|nr:complex I NDUFA9 subunit family protein [Desulfofalx alkaliphila]
MILVTGATGYLGRHVVDALYKAGLKVRCLVRDTKDVNLPEVELVRGDINDPVSLAVACTGVDIVIHLVAIIREKKGLTFQDINIKGTENILNSAKECGVKHFIHVSALGASTTKPKLKYIYSKGVAEVKVTNSGLKYTILRPSVIFGPGFGFVDRLLQAIRMTPTVVALPGDGSAKFQPIYVKDVAKCILEVAGQPNQYINKCIDLGGPEHLTYEQMLDTVMEITDSKKTKVPVPMVLARLAAAVMQRFMSDPPVTTGELALLSVNNTTDINAVKKHFGFEPLRLAEGLEYLRYKVKNQDKDEGAK